MKKYLILFIISISVLYQPLFCDDVGTTGLSFLKLGVGARSLAMGEAVSAVSFGPEALYRNPAGLIGNDRPTLMLTYSPLVENVSASQAAASAVWGRFAFGLGYNGLNYDPIDSYDAVGNKGKEYGASDQMTLMGLAFGGKHFAFGVAGKLINSEIDNVSTNASAFNAGVMFMNPFLRYFHHSLLAENIGNDVSFLTQEDPLPTSYTFGHALYIGSRLLISGEVSDQKRTGTLSAGGLEWKFLSNDNRSVLLRGGYTTKRNEADKLSGAAFGIGFLFKAVALDYAWLPYGELGNSHAATLLWRIPKIEKTDRGVVEPRPVSSRRRSLRTLEEKGEPERRATDKDKTNLRNRLSEPSSSNEPEKLEQPKSFKRKKLGTLE